MGDEQRALRPVAVATKWLENPRVWYDGGVDPAATGGQALSSLVMAGARVSVAEPGRVVCTLRVRAPLTDAAGRWHAGAVAAAVDNMCSAVAFTVEGAPTSTVSYGLSFFSPAGHDEVVVMEGRAVSRKGKLTAAVVEVRKEESGELVAIGRQWVTPAWPTKSNKSSKL
ncbi:hypothetical protein ACP70R_030734 [Stipagrostis hirtigluma subsp. patula]